MARRKKNAELLLVEANKEITLQPTLYTEDVPKKKGDKAVFDRLYHSAQLGL